jgi:hypothetical protein
MVASLNRGGRYQMEPNIPHQVRKALRAILQEGHGLTNDQAIAEFKDKHSTLVMESSDYFHRLALIKILCEVSDSRQSGDSSNSNQGELFDGCYFPQIISVIVIGDDGRIQRIRKDFLDATVEEAEAFCAPVVRKNTSNDSRAKTSEFVKFVRPYVPSGGTLRDGLNAVRKRTN